MANFISEIKVKVKINDNVLLSVFLPLKENVLKEAEKQISYWLEGSTEKEKKHYRVAFRRSYEYIVRVKNKRIFDLFLNAMDEYAKVKMIEENKSLLEMAKIHMDSRAILVISERIFELEKYK